MIKVFTRRVRAALFVTGATAAFVSPAMAQEQVAQDEEASAPIIVTGSRTVRNGADQPTPVTVLGQDLIQQSAATNLAQVINELPSVRSDVSSTTSFVGGGGNGPGNNLINLRGLGAVRTLVLVDGLRYPATTFTGLFNTDLIPSSLVSRLDVVTGGASAAYGSDAVAGVVNIQLDHKLEGVRASAQYGVTEAGDAGDQKYSVAMGKRFGDRVRIIAGADYQKRESTGNCYSRDWCAREYGVVSNPTPGLNGQPALVISPNVRASQITPAGLVVSSQLVRAFGGQEVSADGLSLVPFSFGSLYAPNNNQMIGGSRPGINSFSNAFNLQGPLERLATYARLEADLTDSIQFWVDGSYGTTKTQGNFAQLRAGNLNAAGTARSGPLNTGAITLSINNPFLPRQLVTEMQQLRMTSVNIGKAGEGLLVPVVDYDTKTYRIATGLSGKIGTDISWDVNYLHGESVLNNVAHNVINQNNFSRAVQAVNGTGANAGKIVCAVNQATTVDAACEPLNLFGVGTANSRALAYAFGTATQDSRIKLNDVSLNLRASPFDLGAGPVAFAAGAEYRTESIAAEVDADSLAGNFVQNYSPLHGRSKVTEFYGEVNVPLLKDVPFAETLEVNGAIRHAHYNFSSPAAPLSGGGIGPATSSFNALTWKAGAVYKPFGWLRLRGTYSRDFRAPNLNEQYVLPNVQNSAVIDPATTTTTQVPTQSGGNPNLLPEISYTKTVGLTVQPSAIPGLQMSVDYYDIKVKDYIAAVGAPTLVNQCFQGVQAACQFVTRDSAGVLTFVRNVSANANELSVAGFDIELGYRHALGKGTIDLRVLSTIYSKLTYVNGGQPISGKCQNGTVTQQAYPSMPCYEINTRVTYKTGPLTLGTQLRYLPKGKFGNIYVGPQDAGYDPTLANSINNNRVPARL